MKNNKLKGLIENINNALQKEAKSRLGRELTIAELEDRQPLILKELSWSIEEAIDRIDYDNLLERNKGAENKTPHYRVDWQPCDHNEPDTAHYFKKEKDAEQYRRLCLPFCSSEEYTITKVWKDKETLIS